MPGTKIINGKEYQYVTRRNIMEVARKIARELIAEGKDAVVDRINSRTFDVYVREIKEQEG